MKKWNLKVIMKRAWDLFKKGVASFGECLHRSWMAEKAKEINEARIQMAKAQAGITEKTATYTEWKALGYEVIHGMKALFGCDLIWATKGDGKVYKARFFGESQVQSLS